MRSQEIIIAIIGAMMALAINWRALASHQLPANRLAKLAMIWLAIIVGGALIARYFVG